jgi:xanthine dehydrogenase YagS FAD-binding subunit
MLNGSAPTEQTFVAAADAELSAVSPLPGNEFKVTLTRRVLSTTLRSLTEEAR